MKRTDLRARFVFVAPPSLAELERRLRQRGTEDEASVQRRLETARRELAFAETPGVHDAAVVNDDLDAAYRRLRDFIFTG